MPEAILAGHATAWRSWDRGGARPVLALHCALAHAGAWAGLAEALQDVSLTAPDLPGHGRSEDWDGIADYHALATASATALAEMVAQGGQIDLIGHSLGGSVALRMAIERPDLIRSLTLIEPVVFAIARQDEAWEGFAAGQQAAIDLTATGQAQTAAAQFHAVWGGDTGFDALPDRQRRYMVDRMPLIAAPHAVLAQDSAQMLPRLASVQLPVQLIEGVQSPPIIAAVMRELALALPQARRSRIGGAGHMVALTHAPEVAATLRSFWGR